MVRWFGATFYSAKCGGCACFLIKGECLQEKNGCPGEAFQGQVAGNPHATVGKVRFYGGWGVSGRVRAADDRRIRCRTPVR